MISLTLRDFENIPQASIQLPASGRMFEAPVRGISINTRTLQPREIFWAIKGQTHDGHWYVSDAEKKGAVAAVGHHRRPDLGHRPGADGRRHHAGGSRLYRDGRPGHAGGR